jgi:NTE family protein
MNKKTARKAGASVKGASGGKHGVGANDRYHRVALPGQVVLVLQGGGALGAFQVGAYEALQKAGIEPDWVIGTSIGAINGAIIAGNPPERRLEKLHAFWQGVEQREGAAFPAFFAGLSHNVANFATFTRGISTFFEPNLQSLLGAHARLGIEQAAYYSTAPLRKTLAGLVDLDYINARHTRLTVGAVNATDGEMRYFDSRDQAIDFSHIMASGALPPAFPAIRIDGEPYWDGGIYSNTPVEAVLDDKPRKDSVIFTVNLWMPRGDEPATLWEVMGREKDIQYASRAKSHIARQQQIHHLRHIIRQLSKNMPAKVADSAEMRELASWGCGTVMHVVPLVAPALGGEDQLKDIDFTPNGIRERMTAGRDVAGRAAAAAPWRRPVDEMAGIIVHDDAMSMGLREPKG